MKRREAGVTIGGRGGGEKKKKKKKKKNNFSIATQNTL